MNMRPNTSNTRPMRAKVGPAIVSGFRADMIADMIDIARFCGDWDEDTLTGAAQFAKDMISIASDIIVAAEQAGVDVDSISSKH